MISCNKGDETLPNLTVTAPLNNLNFVYDDVILIQGTASDETKLKTLKAELFTTSMQSVGLSSEQQPTSNNFYFSFGLSLDDKYLPTGSYILKIVAIDRAGNEKSTFKNISYTELPLSLNDIYVIDAVGTSTYNLSKINGTTTSFVRNFSGSFKGAVANLFHQQLLFIGNNNGKLIAYEPSDNQIAWEVNPLQTLGDYFQHIYYHPDDRLTYVTSSDVLVKGYNKTGVTQAFVSPSGALVPTYVYRQGDYLFLERKQGISKEFSSYYTASNSLFQSMTLTGDVASVIQKNENELYLFTNAGSQSTMNIYTIANGTVWSPISMPSGKVNAAFMYSSNEIFIAHESGILRYSYSNNSLVTWVSGVDAKKLYFDKVNNRMVAVVGNQIRYYDLSGNLIGTVTHTSTIADALLFYNK